MKSTVRVGVVVLLLAVVVAASAFVVEDLDFGAENFESEQLAERDQRQKTEAGLEKSQSAPDAKASCEQTCKVYVSGTRCVRRFFRMCFKRVTFQSCAEYSYKCTDSKTAARPAPAISLDDRQLERVESVDEQQKLQAAIAVLESDSQKIFSELYDEQVMRAEKYEYPTAKVGGSLSKENNLASVVLTLTNGNRYEVIQEQGLSDTVGKQTTIIMAEALPEDWVLVETKDIQFSRVVDYIRASDSSLSNKGAVNKMMSLD